MKISDAPTGVALIDKEGKLIISDQSIQAIAKAVIKRMEIARAQGRICPNK